MPDFVNLPCADVEHRAAVKALRDKRVKSLADLGEHMSQYLSHAPFLAGLDCTLHAPLPMSETGF